MAAELLDLYARRQVARGYTFPPDTRWQRELESAFLYEDTPDQRRATEEVKRGMEDARPMDRLLVGDVGYGKTEVAVRAAFKAVQGGKQAAVLVPTTLLADQHGRTFGERLADFPVKVVVLSRFQTAKEQKSILAAAGPGRDRRHHRDAPAAVEGRRVQGSRSPHRGRGAPLRGQAQGAAQGTAARGGRPDPDGDTDSTDPAPVPRGTPGPEPDRDAAARSLTGAHLHRALGRRTAGGGVRPRAGPRRAGVHGPQPDRDHRHHRRAGASPGAASHRRGRARPDGGRPTSRR